MKNIDISNLVREDITKVKRSITLLLALAVLATPFFALAEVFAASASISLVSPRSVAKGSIATVSIYVNSDVGVNGAGATLSYPANLVDYVSIGSSSAFSVAAGGSGGGGTVKVERGALSPVSGRQLLATVRFRAKVDSGTANIAITGGNVYQDSADILGGRSGTSFTLTPPAPAAPAPVADTAAPTITDLKVTDIGIEAATVTWKTSEPANSIVNYGFTKDYGIVAQDNNMVTDHKVQLNPAVLGPLMPIHFLVKSADAAGNTGQSEDQSFTTEGFTVNVKVTDKASKKPVKGAIVKLESAKVVSTDEKGVAVVKGLPDGTVLGTVTFRDKETFVSFTVEPLTNEKLAVQDAAVSIDAPGLNIPLLAGLAILLLLIIGVVGYIVRNNKGGGSGGLTGLLSGVAAKLAAAKSGILQRRHKQDSVAAPETEGTELSSTDTDTGSVSGDEDSNNSPPTVIKPTQ